MVRQISLSRQEKSLLKLARKAARKAYAPYSSFKVGAALRTTSGHIYSGCNVEDVSFPLGTCAERNAIAAAVREEGAKMKIAEIAIAAFKQGKHASVAPCGGCRQAIYEFGPMTKVIFLDGRRKERKVLIGELLPEAFRF